MYQVVKELKFEAGHRLVMGYEGKCHSLHGHSWKVKICLSADYLDEFGMVRDFGEFKIIKDIIDEHIDHSLILYKDDPVIFSLINFPEMRIFAVDYNPTSENLAKAFCVMAQQAFEEDDLRVMVQWVEVDETCTSAARYYPDE